MPVVKCKKNLSQRQVNYRFLYSWLRIFFLLIGLIEKNEMKLCEIRYCLRRGEWRTFYFGIVCLRQLCPNSYLKHLNNGFQLSCFANLTNHKSCQLVHLKPHVHSLDRNMNTTLLNISFKKVKMNSSWNIAIVRYGEIIKLIYSSRFFLILTLIFMSQI